jgi:transcriptional regulator with XRE-family HTH domain
MMTATDKMTEMPIELPDVDDEGFTALRRWREDSGITYQQAADMLGVSVATYYRYETGFQLNVHKANRIVRMTHGAVRYRDLVGGFIPEYA